MVDFADYPVESQSFPRGQKAIFEAKGRSMDHWREEGKVWAALSFLVQILVQIKLFVKPGLESMSFSWTKNSVISRFL